MNRIEEVPHMRSYFRQCGSDEAMKIKLVEQIRDVALEYLPPAVIAKVPKPYYSDEARAAYAAKGISLEWNLSIRGDTGIDTFCFVAQRDVGLSPSQQSAAKLLSYCTEAIDKNAVTEQLQVWILDAYAGLDLDAVDGRKKSTKALVKARSAAAENKKAKTDEYYGLWRDWAANIHKAFPSYLHGKLAEEVKKLADAAGHKMVNGNLYSVVTIKDVITGVKKASKNTP